tara:strand:+ start:611 stop:1369 length:759 start_codon:yes stop_codon:yes gene_type:complete
MQKSKTRYGILGLLEKFIRRHPLIYYFFRSIIINFNIFEEDFNILIKFFKKKKINIIDVGASDGIATKFFLKNLKVKKIYCYEPHIYFLKKLENLKKKYKNIIIKRYGISNKKQSTKIFYPIFKFFNEKYSILTYTFYDKKDLQNQILVDFGNKRKLEIYETKIKLFKFKKIKYKIDLIKVDVNGFEYIIIKSMLSQIKRDKPIIVLENNSKINKISYILKNLNYRMYYNDNLKFKPFKNQKVLDIFFICKK